MLRFNNFARQTMRGLLMTMILTMFLITILAGGHTMLYAQSSEPESHRAGLVVVHGDGSVVSRCVGFQEESINGYDLLVRGGFAPRSDVTSMGVSVCSVDGQGCGEGEDCFCQCQSSPCVYWTYWQQLPEGWRYSNAGPATVLVSDGVVQGWVWGESRANADAESAPPALAFADICTSDAVVYGLEATEETTSFSQTSWGIEQPWLVALVVAAPLLAGGAWWLLRRRAVQL